MASMFSGNILLICCMTKILKVVFFFLCQNLQFHLLVKPRWHMYELRQEKVKVLSMEQESIHHKHKSKILQHNNQIKNNLQNVKLCANTNFLIRKSLTEFVYRNTGYYDDSTEELEASLSLTATVDTHGFRLLAICNFTRETDTSEDIWLSHQLGKKNCAILKFYFWISLRGQSNNWYRASSNRKGKKNRNLWSQKIGKK